MSKVDLIGWSWIEAEVLEGWKRWMNYLLESGARISQNCCGATVFQTRANRTMAAASINP